MKKYDMPHHMHIKDSLAPKKPMMWSLLSFDLYITTDRRLGADSANRDQKVEPKIDNR
jgi:hypothetical protein